MSKTVTLDSTDIQILRLLQEDGKISNADIARRLEMAPSAIFERMRKLEERGVITGYDVRINPKAVGLGLLAFMFVRSNEVGTHRAVAAALVGIPEVLEVHHIAGEDCFLVKMRVEDTDHLAKILREGIGNIPSIISTRTTIVFETLKDSSYLPIRDENTTG